MTSVYRTTAVWQGFQGAPGYTKFSWQNLLTDADRNAAGAGMKAFFDAFVVYLKSGWSVQVQTEVAEYDMSTGQLLGAVSMTSAPGVTSGTVGVGTQYAGGSGLSVQWNTALVFAGRRVRGRTYMVPLVSCFEQDGTLLPAVITAGTNAGNTLIALAGADFSVWHRTYNTANPPVQVGGAIASVSTVLVRDQASQLRTRRL